MRIAAARLHRYSLPLRAQWMSAAGEVGVREGWLLRLETDAGLVGYGDCAPLPQAGTEGIDFANRALQAWRHELPGQDLHGALEGLAGFETPAARAAVECALLDLLAQGEARPLARRLNRAAGASVRVNAVLGALTSVLDEEIAAACAAGFTVLKLKVGVGAVEDELARLRALAGALPAGVRLRLDANRAWDEATAARVLAACAAPSSGLRTGLPIEGFEEPLAAPEAPALRRLQAACPFPLALDESWPPPDGAAFFADPPVRRLVLKPPRLGGLLPSLTVARRAARAGLECVLTSSVDSACGVLAAAHLAAALGNGLAHGLATGPWLAKDLGTQPALRGGELVLPAGPGLGFAPRAGLDFS